MKKFRIETEFDGFVAMCFKQRPTPGQMEDLKRTFAAGALSLVKMLGETEGLKEPEAEHHFVTMMKDAIEWSERLAYPHDTGRN